MMEQEINKTNPYHGSLLSEPLQSFSTPEPPSDSGCAEHLALCISTRSSRRLSCITPKWRLRGCQPVLSAPSNSRCGQASMSRSRPRSHCSAGQHEPSRRFWQAHDTFKSSSSLKILKVPTQAPSSARGRLLRWPL